MTLRTHQGRARHSVRTDLSLTQPLSRSRRAGNCAPCLIALLLLLASQTVGAQLQSPADDIFNGGAQLYISNNIPAALERVETGLKIYPDDAKLKQLEQLLKQQQQQQQKQDQQKQQQDQQKQQQDKNQQPQNSQDQQKSEQQKSEEQKQKEAEQKKAEEQKQQEQQKAAADKKDDEKKDQAEAQPVKPGQMTPEEAKRLLDAQKDNEQLLQMKPQDKPRDTMRPVKDW